MGRKDIVLAPHIASATIETRTKMAVMAANNAVAALEGRRPPNALNADKLDSVTSGGTLMPLVTRNQSETHAGGRSRGAGRGAAAGGGNQRADGCRRGR